MLRAILLFLESDRTGRRRFGIIIIIIFFFGNMVLLLLLLSSSLLCYGSRTTIEFTVRGHDRRTIFRNGRQVRRTCVSFYAAPRPFRKSGNAVTVKSTNAINVILYALVLTSRLNTLTRDSGAVIRRDLNTDGHRCIYKYTAQWIDWQTIINHDDDDDVTIIGFGVTYTYIRALKGRTIS